MRRWHLRRQPLRLAGSRFALNSYYWLEYPEILGRRAVIAMSWLQPVKTGWHFLDGRGVAASSVEGNIMINSYSQTSEMKAGSKNKFGLNFTIHTLLSLL